MVLNDWQRGKLPFFVPPPGCALEPKPDDVNAEEVEEEEAEADDDDDDNEEEDNDDDADVGAEEENEESDAETTFTADTTQTTDTTHTADSTQTTDSLFENIKFKDYDDDQGSVSLPTTAGERVSSARKLPTNLQELVKQNFKKIVPSVEYFDEEKFEGGRKKKKTKGKTTTTTSTPSSVKESNPDTQSYDSAEKEVTEKEPSNVSDQEKRETLASQQVETSGESQPVAQSSKRKTPLTSSSPAARKKSKAASAASLQVKTKSGTFSVSDV